MYYYYILEQTKRQLMVVSQHVRVFKCISRALFFCCQHAERLNALTICETDQLAMHILDILIQIHACDMCLMVVENAENVFKGHCFLDVDL